jgi:pseudaminic acid biosynthesis-associated methylase
MVKTYQEKVWSSEMGKDYTDRNTLSPNELDKLYIENYGISRTQINKEFLLPEIDSNNRILEIGCNVGNQFLMLLKMGFNNLWGIELQQYAVEISKNRTKGVNIIQGSAFDLPFKDEYFDLLFTSGVLIHISPTDIEQVLKEMYRCSKKYIWGLEYFSTNGYENILYRGQENLLWKTDFAQLFLNQFPNLKLIKRKILKYQNNQNEDLVYLLKKV